MHNPCEQFLFSCTVTFQPHSASHICHIRRLIWKDRHIKQTYCRCKCVMAWPESAICSSFTSTSSMYGQKFLSCWYWAKTRQPCSDMYKTRANSLLLRYHCQLLTYILSICIYLYPSLSLLIHPLLSLSLSLYIYIYIFPSLTFSCFLFLSFCSLLSLYLPIPLFLLLSLFLTFFPPLSLSFSLSLSLSLSP